MDKSHERRIKRSSSRLPTGELERRTYLFRDGREQTEARATDLELSSCRGTRDWTGGWKKWLVFVTRVTHQPIDGSILRTAFTAATWRWDLIWKNHPLSMGATVVCVH